MRDNAANPNLPRRIGGCGYRALSAASAAASAPTAADGELSGRIDGPCWCNLSSSAAASAASTPGASLRRTRLIFKGRRESAGRPLSTQSGR